MAPNNYSCLHFSVAYEIYNWQANQIRSFFYAGQDTAKMHPRKKMVKNTKIFNMCVLPQSVVGARRMANV